MKRAQIEAGVVINIIVLDAENVPTWCAGWPDAATAKIGDTYAEGVFTTPEPEPAPEVIEPTDL
jgi:hypothetical protein